MFHILHRTRMFYYMLLYYLLLKISRLLTLLVFLLPPFSCRLPASRASTLPSCTSASRAKMTSWWSRSPSHPAPAPEPSPCPVKMASVHPRTGTSPRPRPRTLPPRLHAAVGGESGEWRSVKAAPPQGLIDIVKLVMKPCSYSFDDHIKNNSFNNLRFSTVWYSNL